jgi:hypothetical protein
MPKTKISEFSATPGNNTDIDGINIAEGCAPSGINDAIRELMSQLKDFQAGTAGDSFNGPVGTTTAAAGAFTNLSASGTFALTGDQVQISEGGTGQTTANAAFNALAPSQTSNAGKYLKTDGTNTSWDALDISTADITGTLPVANGGTGVTSSTGTGSVVLSASPTFTGTVNGASLTLSSSLTLSGGTANGVAYLNGSKVLTSGSALTFDGVRLGVGVATPLQRIHAAGNIGLNTGVQPGANGNGIAIYASDFPRLTLRNSTTGDADSDGLQIYMVGNDVSYDLVENGYQRWNLNGSEEMRLTSTGLGIGTSSPAVKLQSNVSRTSGQNVTALVLSDTVTGAQTSGFGTQIQGWSNNGSAQSAIGFEAYGGTNNDTALGFYTQTSAGGLTRRMTISSTGDVGIGTGSPAYKLDVSGSVIRLNNSGSTADIFLTDSGTTNGHVRLRGESNAMKFITGNGISATLDSSGNLGLGVTPSAWWSSTKAIQIGAGGVISGRTDTAARNYFASNAYLNSTPAWTYIATNYATRYEQNDGQHQWFTAPSGTAGNAVSFTQALTLTANANLLLGGTSDPGGEKALYIANTSSVPGTPTGGGVLYVEGGALKYKGSSGTVTTIANA